MTQVGVGGSGRAAPKRACTAYVYLRPVRPSAQAPPAVALHAPQCMQ